MAVSSPEDEAAAHLSTHRPAPTSPQVANLTLDECLLFGKMHDVTFDGHSFNLEEALFRYEDAIRAAKARRAGTYGALLKPPPPLVPHA
jgi:hypothetical protein